MSVEGVKVTISKFPWTRLYLGYRLQWRPSACGWHCEKNRAANRQTRASAFNCELSHLHFNLIKDIYWLPLFILHIFAAWKKIFFPWNFEPFNSNSSIFLLSFIFSFILRVLEMLVSNIYNNVWFVWLKSLKWDHQSWAHLSTRWQQKWPLW